MYHIWCNLCILKRFKESFIHQKPLTNFTWAHVPNLDVMWDPRRQPRILLFSYHMNVACDCVKRAATIKRQSADKLCIQWSRHDNDVVEFKTLFHLFFSLFFIRLYCARVMYVWFMWTLCIRKRGVLHHNNICLDRNSMLSLQLFGREGRHLSHRWGAKLIDYQMNFC